MQKTFARALFKIMTTNNYFHYFIVVDGNRERYNENLTRI